MIQAERDARGLPQRTAICDGCGRKATVRAMLGPDGREGEGQMRRKLVAAGWRIKGPRLTCPNCARPEPPKERMMPESKTAPHSKPPATSTPRRPTREQNRRIHEELEGCYDVRLFRYLGADSDQTVATRLNVPWAWVAEIRKAFFGDGDGNEAEDQLGKDIGQMQADLAALKGMIQHFESTLTALEKRVKPPTK